MWPVMGVEWKCWVQGDVASYGGGMEMLGSR